MSYEPACHWAFGAFGNGACAQVAGPCRRLGALGPTFTAPAGWCAVRPSAAVFGPCSILLYLLLKVK